MLARFFAPSRRDVALGALSLSSLLLAVRPVSSAEPKKAHYGVALPTDGAYFEQMRGGIVKSAHIHEVPIENIEISNYNSAEQLVQILGSFVDKKVDAVIFYSRQPDASAPMISKANSVGIFTVAVGQLDAVARERVAPDFAAAGQLLAQFLNVSLPKGGVVLRLASPDPARRQDIGAAFEASLEKKSFKVITVVMKSFDPQQVDAEIRKIQLGSPDAFDVIVSDADVFALSWLNQASSDKAKGAPIVSVGIEADVVQAFKSQRTSASVDLRPDLQGEVAFDKAYSDVQDGEGPCKNGQKPPCPPTTTEPQLRFVGK